MARTIGDPAEVFALALSPSLVLAPPPAEARGGHGFGREHADQEHLPRLLGVTAGIFSLPGVVE
jgi:hypothetical protein